MMYIHCGFDVFPSIIYSIQLYSRVIKLYKHIYIYMYTFFFIFFSNTGYYKMLNIVPCAVQQVLVYPFLYTVLC